jgi:hypothetical protein
MDVPKGWRPESPVGHWPAIYTSDLGKPMSFVPAMSPPQIIPVKLHVNEDGSWQIFEEDTPSTSRRDGVIPDIPTAVWMCGNGNH